MSDIRQWLEKLDLGQYADAFEENAIDLGALPHVKDEDLLALGVPLGHRRRLQAAVASLEQERPGEPAAVLTEAQALGAKSGPDAERRQITVMFCDLVGSTALSEQLDPEDLREVLTAYQKTAGAVIERYDGHVAQYLGDGLMIYFGWPKAHEDDAQRAVRAGLEIVTAVQDIEAPSPLSVRVGISTGPVVVGETGDGDASVPKAAIGETPNLAARVQGLAAPNTVTIGEATRRLIGGAFELEDLGAQDLKGIAAPVALFRVIGASDVESRFDASCGAGLTPLVGRDEEVGLLFKRWEQAKDGEGQVVLLSGEAGIGKSRITQTLRERIGEEPHTRLRYQCSPYHTNSAFYPVIDQVERAAGFARGDDADAKLDKLETLLAQSADNVTDIAPLFAAMLSLSLDRYPPLNLSPQKQKENTIAALADQVALLADQRPVLMIFEDAHWIDPTTLEVLGAMIERVRESAALMVITHRPEFDPPWAGHGHVGALTLNRLSRRQGADMVAKVTGSKPLPDEVLDQIVAKTDGVPLFVEELTKTVLEAGFLKDSGDAYALDGPLPPLAIPATLQDSLMARLDRLSRIKEIAQIGACIGREFSYELLAAVSPLRDNELQDALQQFVDSELVFQRGAPPDATYTFKHALVQDAAYESLLKSRRQRLHTAIAQSLEEHFSEKVENEPELGGYHYTRGGLNDRAIPYWRRAGQRAMARSANKEAIAHFSQALDLLANAPESAERDGTEASLRCLLGPALMADAGSAGPVVEQNYVRARALCRHAGSTDELFAATWGLWFVTQQSGRYDAAAQLAEEVLRLAERDRSEDHKLQAHHAAWTTSLFRQRLNECWHHAEQGIALYNVEKHAWHTYQYAGHDPGVCARTVGAQALWFLGFLDRAGALALDARAVADRLDHPGSKLNALFMGLFPFQYRHDVERLRRQAEEVITLGEACQMTHYVGGATILQGWAIASGGDVSDGIGRIEEGMRIHAATGMQLRRPYYRALLAEVQAMAGNGDAALKTLREARCLCKQTGDSSWLPEVLRLEGDILGTGSATVAACEAAIRQALDLARRRSARALELRAATSLARVWAGQRERQKAYDLLFPVYDWFTEGFDTADLKDAKALLEELK